MILPYITNKQKQILLLLYRFRFLHRIHIQKLLNNKDHKNTNIRLKDLSEKQYIERVEEEKIPGINKPYKYRIAVNGIRFLTTQDSQDLYLKRLHQEKRKSEKFIGKCLFIADVYLNLLEESRTKGYTLKFYTQTDFPVDGEIQTLLPSFAYVIETKDNLEHYACEIIEEHMPRFAMRWRIKKYIEYFTSDDSSTHIVLICQTEKSRQYVEKFTRKTLEEESADNILVSTTTQDRMKVNDIGEALKNN